MTQRLLGENKEKKRFSVLGDSLSTFEGYSEPAYAVFYDTARKLASGVITYADTWWGRVIDALGGELLVNNSFAGSTVCKRPDYEIPSYACSDERTSALAKDGVLPDVVFVYVGTNDWGRGFRVRKDENEWEEDECVFSTAYDRMLKKLRKNYPHAEIYCFTLAVGKISEDTSSVFPYAYGGIHMEEYCDAIRSIAKANGCRLIDLYRYAEPYETVDGAHANASGMKTLADAVLSRIEAETLAQKEGT